MAGLPRSGELIVEHRKVVDYLLSTAHPDGASKARFFYESRIYAETMADVG